ncbi:hypothetical protein SteCoe_24163 [Stentor coeruleus]|uniref:Uncharacterized protein n=1 Tax=Stentor coeruleus TaxID=5963 RepID=A0A1R2BI51_9CILI|nr:hypothetical protein SteCoe_24163 [Stentor coeruleus]
MGCYNSAKRNPPESSLINRVLGAIERNEMSSVKSLSKKICHFKKIDDEIGEIENIKLNALGYALWTGKIEPFAYIHRTLNASIKAMEDLFIKSELTSLHIICAKGHLEILKYYLPHYLKEITEMPEIQEYTTNFGSQIFIEETSNLNISSPHYLPIHIVTIQENLPMLAFIHTHFSNKSYIPRLLDMEYKEEITGENCVLLACRKANYKLIFFFHKTCKLNFRVKNNAGFNGINVLLDGYKTGDDKNVMNCLRYLVEKIGLDVEYKHSFNLKAAKDQEIVRYLEGKLLEQGIFVKKHDFNCIQPIEFDV